MYYRYHNLVPINGYANSVSLFLIPLALRCRMLNVQSELLTVGVGVVFR